MEQQNEQPQAEKFEPVNYEEKIPPQREKMEKLEKDFEKNPSDELRSALDRETDRLRHYENAARKNPKARARQAAETARKITLNKAVQQLPE